MMNKDNVKKIVKINDNVWVDGVNNQERCGKMVVCQGNIRSIETVTVTRLLDGRRQCIRSRNSI